MDLSYHSLRDPITNVNENIEVTFSNGTYREVYTDKTANGKERTIFSFRSPYRHNSNVKISETKAITGIEQNNYGASTTVALDQKMETNYRLLLAKFNRHRDENDLRPSEARKHIINELNEALSNCLDLIISSLGDVESDRGTLYFQKSDQSTEFEYNLLSSGEKEVVDILVDLFVRKDDYDDTVFLIDEPDLHLNTAIERKLLNEIDNLIGKNCQIWVVTHSIGFLRALQDDIESCQVIYFEPKTDFATSKHVLEPIPKTRKRWQKIFETALDDLTGLVAPRRLIYCEGKAESPDGMERGLDAIVYNNIFGEKENDTLFISSGGNTEPEQRRSIALTILNKALPDVEIFVLSDRDIMSGQITTENDRQNYLREHNYRRMLKRREIENYLYDKEVLKSMRKRTAVNLTEKNTMSQLKI